MILDSNVLPITPAIKDELVAVWEHLCTTNLQAMRKALKTNNEKNIFTYECDGKNPRNGFKSTRDITYEIEGSRLQALISGEWAINIVHAEFKPNYTLFRFQLVRTKVNLCRRETLHKDQGTEISVTCDLEEGHDEIRHEAEISYVHYWTDKECI